ncbi:MAG: response regulator [Candidatus Omnitrophica bacterium]|nr:response regulator [Candidatus Omnitrophota bacterium]
MAKKILLVEDEEDVLKTLKLILTKEGFSVDCAQDGVMALNKLRQEKFDLIVLDLMLPKWDGFKLCKLLKQDIKYKTTPLLILTAKTQESDRERCLAYGADEFMTKPFNPDELIDKIKQLSKINP